ncbi:hypothetical protein [Blastomonas sp.]|uniref:hypothetical protein n=1 Tax=Blastomonas sp. TaxID=1909299 RepID=UPI00261ED08C|nr:hypothetical protein [Blastomonas sp.]MDM7956288.1 hypothetical protein [Blastomonas sp.]
MRISEPSLVIGTAALLAACSPSEPGSLPGEDDSRIACALGDEAEFTEQCEAERVQNGDRRELVMRHPDGGFRRFEIVSDGRGLVVADGSEEAIVTPLSDGRIELSVGTDRYQLPATVRPGAGGG